MLLNKDDRVLCCAEKAGDSPLRKGERLLLEQSVAGWCVSRRRAATIPDFRDDPRAGYEAYQGTAVRSGVVVPVLQDDPVAVIEVYWSEARKATPEELCVLQIIADCAGLALENAELKFAVENTKDRLHEYAHRIKNIFAVSMGLVRQTKARTVSEFRNTLIGRLYALEQSHAAIIEQQNNIINFADFVGRILSVYEQSSGPRLCLQGPEISVSSGRISDLALIIHELATNAAKYGALSRKTGVVRISWDQTKEGLFLSWQETGGPPVHAPSSRGFGTRLIEGIASYQLAGRVQFDYRPEGVRCEIFIPVPERGLK